MPEPSDGHVISVVRGMCFWGMKSLVLCLANKIKNKAILHILLKKTDKHIVLPCVLHNGPNCKTGFTLGSKQLVCSAVASLRAMDMLCRRAAQAGIPIDEVDSTFSGLQSRQPEEKFI